MFAVLNGPQEGESLQEESAGNSHSYGIAVTLPVLAALPAGRGSTDHP